MTVVDDAIADPIKPIEIGHHVDEIWRDVPGGQLDQRYNFIDYHFEIDGAYMSGRAYADSMEEVIVEGPYLNRASDDRIDSPALETAVLAYFARRFAVVRRH